MFSEIRFKKFISEKNEAPTGKIQNTESKGRSFGIFTYFHHLKLFRISGFVLRIFCSR